MRSSQSHRSSRATVGAPSQVTPHLRTVRVRRLVDCPFSAAMPLALEVVTSKVRAIVEGRDRWLRWIEIEALCVDDAADSVRAHEALAFRWQPKLHFLPTAQALLTARPHAPPGARLQLRCAYLPPYGRVGRLGDATLGRFVAALAAKVVLFGIARAIEERRRAIQRVRGMG